MKLTFLASPKNTHQQCLFLGAVEGLLRRGVDARYSTEPEADTKNVACWGWRGGSVLKAAGHNVLVFERGYLGDRFKYTSIAWNGLNRRGNFCISGDMLHDRFTRHHRLLKWRDGGDYIVIMGQVPGDMSLMGKDLTAVYEETAKNLKQIHGLPVYFRPHPHGRNFNPAIPHIQGTLEEALARAYMVVVYNSNSGVDAIVNGVPTIALDEGCMAWDVTGKSLSDRVMPDRRQWAANLAHCQWTPEEINRGEYWDRMQCGAET